MPVESNGHPSMRENDEATRIRVAAAGDVHCSEANRNVTARAFKEIDGTVDLILLAGDLTTHGEPHQGAVLADACRDLQTPIVAVLGNHDWHADRAQELTEVLEDGGIEMIDRAHTIKRPKGAEVGIVGAKGYVGGFPGCHIPDFGEPSTRELYAETGAEVDALEEGLKAVAHCPLRLVVLHYAPTTETLIGEPEPIWAFLGADRLAAPIVAHQPDLVVHGHAHAGTFEGEVGGVPVYNVSVPVMKRDFWVFELTAAATRTAIH